MDVFSGKAKLVDAATGKKITFPALAGVNYLVERRDMPIVNQKFQAVSGTAATTPKKLRSVQLGFFRDAD